MKKRRAPARPPIPPDVIKKAADYFLQGASVPDIKAKLETDYPDQDALEIIDEVFQTFERSGQQSPDVVRGFCFECARELYRRMLECGDFTGALAAVKEISKIEMKPPTPAGDILLNV